MASAFSGAAELCLHQGRTHSLIKQLPQKLDEILSFAFRFNTESCDSALCRKLFIRLPENLTQLGSPPHKQTPGHEWCLGQQWDARTTMEEFLNHYCCLFIDIEYFYAQQFLWISGVNELYKIHTSSSFLFHEMWHFLAYRFWILSSRLHNTKKIIAYIMKTRNLMVWDVLQYDEWIKLICFGVIAFDDSNCAL